MKKPCELTMIKQNYCLQIHFLILYLQQISSYDRKDIKTEVIRDDKQVSDCHPDGTSASGKSTLLKTSLGEVLS